MNYAIVLRLLSYILYCEAALLLLPAMASLIYGEWMVLGVFLLTAALSAVAGALLHRIKPKSQIFYMREGFATTALCWLLISVVGAVPFVLTGSIPNPVDAMFETVSGFTTTGASILPAVEDLPRGILFWRSFTHWIGGMGVLVFLLSLLPLTGGSHVNLMKAESPGPQVDKLVPKVQSTAKILYGIYFGLTVIEFVFLLFGGMPVFEALLTSFGTAGTGGFGFRNDSFASMSPYVQWVVTIFMILFGVNFNAYFLLLMRRFRRAAASEEVRAYFVIIGVAVVIITANIYSMYNGLGEALRHAAFQVGSIITTTGFSSCDFDLWPTLSKEILVMLMFVGACAGSTGGGMKVSRLLLMGKTVGKELKQALHPQVVAPVRMDGKVVNHETIRATNVYVAAYIFIFAASFFLISLDGFDMVTNFTAIAATADDKWLFRDVPDEPDVAAEILVADGFAMADEAGNPLWLTDSDCMAGEGAWLRLTDCDMLVANARRAADAAGESLPMRFPALFEKRPSSSARSGGTVARQCWALSVPSELEASDKAAALARALEAVNTRDDAVMLVHPEGVFVPESLLPVGWIEDPAEAGILLRVKAMPFAEGVRHMRASPIRRVRMTGSSASRAARYDPGLRGAKDGSIELTGVVIKRHSVRPVVRFVNGEGRTVEETEGHWPRVLDMEAIDRDPPKGTEAFRALKRAVGWKPRERASDKA